MFRELKKKFTIELVLAVSDLDKKNEDGSRCIRLCYRRYMLKTLTMDFNFYFPFHFIYLSFFHFLFIFYF